MAMNLSLARQIVLTVTRIVGGREFISPDDALENAGIVSDQIDFLLEWLVRETAKRGYRFDPATLGTVTTMTTIGDVSNILADVSTPKKCKYGHPAKLGTTECSQGHPLVD